MRKLRKILAIGAALAAAISVPAAAAETIWFDTNHTSYGGDYSTGTGLVFTSVGGDVKARATAYSINGSGTIYNASLGVWADGLGVKYGNNDNSHTIDNSSTRDFIMLQFDTVVQLENAYLWTGWHYMNDTDATVGYGTTLTPHTSSLGLNGRPKSDLNSLNLYGNKKAGPDGNSGDSYRDINLSNKYGNVWLIGASFENPEGRYKLDGFKLEKLTFSKLPPVGGVPEPSTWATMLIGFGFVGAAMRAAKRRQRLVASLI